MFFKIKSFFFVCTIFVLSESAFVDNLGKCRVNDSPCMTKLLQKSLRDIGKTGIPEVGIPPIDPFAVKNISVSVLNLIDITMTDGVAKGVKDCVVNKLETNFETDYASLDITCDLTIKGRYKVFSDSPLIKELFGSTSIHGDGLGRVRLEKVNLKFDFHVFVKQIDDEFYIDCQTKDVKYRYAIGKASFAANNLFLGNQEASKLVIGFINDNWNFVLQAFGRNFFDKGIEVMTTNTHRFFDVTPIKNFLIGDLTPYVKN